MCNGFRTGLIEIYWHGPDERGWKGGCSDGASARDLGELESSPHVALDFLASGWVAETPAHQMRYQRFHTSPGFGGAKLVRH